VAATCPSLVYLLVRRGRHLFIISSLLFLSFLFLSFLFYLATASVFSDRYSLHPLCLSIFTTHIYYYNSLFPPYLLSLKTPLLSSHIYTQTLHSLQDTTLASRSPTTRLTTVLTSAKNLTPTSLTINTIQRAAPQQWLQISTPSLPHLDMSELPPPCLNPHLSNNQTSSISWPINSLLPSSKCTTPNRRSKLPTSMCSQQAV